MMKKILSVVVLWSWILLPVLAQDSSTVLTVDDGQALLLQHNYDIQLVRNNVAIAQNNASFLNTGKLPTVTSTAGASYNVSNIDANFQDGSTRSLKGADSRRYNAGVKASYVLFDGFGRKYNLLSLREKYNLSALQARQTVELTLLNYYQAYYEVAKQTANVDIAKEAMGLSASELNRVLVSKKYAQSTALDVLEVEVDLNQDSIAWMEAKRELQLAKHTLNLMLGRAIDTPLEVVDDPVLSKEWRLDSLQELMMENNVVLLQRQRDEQLSQYQLSQLRSNYLPVLSVSGAYDWNKNYNNSASFLASSNSTGLTGGVNFSWTLFDGGAAKVVEQNAKITIDNQRIVLEKAQQEVQQELLQRWTIHQTAKKIKSAQSRSLYTAKKNYEQALLLHKNGQISTLVLRQAQLNWLKGKQRLIDANFEVILTSLALKQSAGILLTNLN